MLLTISTEVVVPKALLHLATKVVQGAQVLKDKSDSEEFNLMVKLTNNDGLLLLIVTYMEVSSETLAILRRAQECVSHINNLRLELRAAETGEEIPTAEPSVTDVFKRIIERQPNQLPWLPGPWITPDKDPYNGPWGPTVVD